MKYKVGDKVRVRKDLKTGERYYSADKGYSDQAAPQMLKMAGKEVTISYAYGECYRIKECDWNWTDEMFEDVPAFKVGDKVIGRKEASNEYDITREGWIGKVTEICNDGSIYVYGEGSSGSHGFNVEAKYFDFYNEPTNEKIVITTNGKTTTAKLYDGKKFVKSAEAKCSPNDKFDFERGAIIAFSRLTDCDYKLADEAEVEKPKFTKEDLKTGMFVLTNAAGWAIIVDDKFIYKKGTYHSVSDLSDDLCFMFDKIDAVVEASSFMGAEFNLKNNKNVLYRRSDK